jgi:hypothetical protein
MLYSFGIGDFSPEQGEKPLTPIFLKLILGSYLDSI